MSPSPQRHTQNARAGLIRACIPARAISVAWRGDDDPAVNTPSGAREPLNRRVLVILGDGPMS
jgi:outer membrane protein OmpA-like peptidoglycan-associated protein